MLDRDLGLRDRDQGKQSHEPAAGRGHCGRIGAEMFEVAVDAEA